MFTRVWASRAAASAHLRPWPSERPFHPRNRSWRRRLRMVAAKRIGASFEQGFASICRQHGLKQTTSCMSDGRMCGILEKSLGRARRRNVAASSHDFNDRHHAEVFMKCDVAMEHEPSGKIAELDPNGNRSILVSLTRRNID